MKSWVREAARRARQPYYGPSLDYGVNPVLLYASCLSNGYGTTTR